VLKFTRADNSLQLYRLVLLHRTVAYHLRRCAPHYDPHELPCIPHLHRVPMHAAAATPERIRFSRHGAARRRAERLDERQVRESTGSNAFDALRVRLFDRLHNAIPLDNAAQA